MRHSARKYWMKSLIQNKGYVLMVQCGKKNNQVNMVYIVIRFKYNNYSL